MLLDLVYETEYHYAPAVPHGVSALRLRPRTDARQRVRTAELHVDPGAVRTTFRDGWGTLVDLGGIATSHDRAAYRLHAVVETGAGAAEEPLGPDARYLFRQPTGRTPLASARRLLPEIGLAGGAWADVEAVIAWIAAQFEHQPGETDVDSPLPVLIETRRGVCQDFAHLALAVLRAWGWPARYVSGYAFTGDQGGLVMEAEAMHAWVDVYLPGHGWLGLDPTSGGAISERYVVVGSARDYDDLAPVRGVLRGETKQAHRSRLRLEHSEQ